MSQTPTCVPLSQLNPVSNAPPGARGFATMRDRAVGDPSAMPSIVGAEHRAFSGGGLAGLPETEAAHSRISLGVPPLPEVPGRGGNASVSGADITA